MKRFFVVLLVLSVMLSGCISGGVNKTQRITLNWKIVSLGTNALSMDTEKAGVNLVGNRYAYQSTEMDRNAIDIEAKVSGSKPTNFDMKIATSNEFERQTNNKILLQTDHAEQGTILVTTDQQEELFEYIVFPAVVLSAWGNPHGETAYSFEQGRKVTFEEADIWFTNPSDGEEPYLFKANVIEVPIVTMDDFWADFVNATNLHELEYEEISFKPDLSKLYYIKTKNGGYAVVRFTASSGWHYNAMYKYSETGIFD